jgi:transcriptional regulator GlxA family with amidase domain
MWIGDARSMLDYTQNLRVERAKDLLQHTRMSVLEVVQTVGFSSPSHFAVVFRRYAGAGPDDWRRGTPAHPTLDHTHH